MPRTSLAALRRRERGLVPRVDPELSAKRRAAAAMRWGKDRQKVEAGRLGGIAATRPAVAPLVAAQNEMLYVQKLEQRRMVERQRVMQTALDASADAVQFLCRLVRGQGDCRDAPFESRRKAALNLLEIAQVHGAGPLKEDPQDRPLNEWTLEQLAAYVAKAEQQIKAVVVDGEAACVDP